MSLKLYQLSETYRNLSDFLSQPSEEGIKFNEEELRNQLAQITEALDEKAENIGKLILEYNSESKAIDEEITRLSNRKRVAENKSTWLKEYLQTEMVNANTDKIQGQILTLSLQKSPPSCIVLDEKLIPEDCFRTIPEKREVDKAKILTEFKQTGEIKPGVQIVTDKKTLRIR